MRSPKERGHHIKRRGGREDSRNPSLFRSGEIGRARERGEKRRVREDRRETEGSMVSSWRWKAGRKEKVGWMKRISEF